MPKVLLNLQEHDFEEIAEKYIVLNGIDYEIGEFVGMGGFKFVFKLINARSRLVHNVIKIFRDNNPKLRDKHKAEVEFHVISRKLSTISAGRISGFSMPRELFCDNHGGTFTVQEYLGSYYIGDEFIEDCVREGNKAIKSNPLEAIKILKSVIQQRPFHTIALNNLGIAYQMVNEHWEALKCFQQAAQIEPHYCPYSYSYISGLANIGALAKARFEYERIRTLYPYSHDIDPIMVEILIASGQPHKAKQVLNKARHHIKDKKKVEILSSKVITALQLKRRADKIIEKSGVFMPENKIHEAYKIHPQNYELSINYALSLMADQHYKEARTILLSKVNIAVETELIIICLANAAYCDLLANKWDDAFPILDNLKNMLVERNNGNPNLSPWDIPSIVNYANKDGLVLQDKPHILLEVMDQIAEGIRTQEEQDCLDFFRRHLKLQSESKPK